MWTAIVLAVVLALLNFLVKPILILFTLPVTILTLGLFLLVINALIILFAENLVPGFQVAGFWWALIFSLLLSFMQAVLHLVLKQFLMDPFIMAHKDLKVALHAKMHYFCTHF